MKGLYILLTSLLILSSTTAQQWTQISSLPASFRTHHTFGFSMDGKGYLVTGSDNVNARSDFYEYDPIADEWTKKPDFPGVGRGFAIGDVLDGKVYLGFGNNGSQNLDDLWTYDPVTNAWLQLADCECRARTHPAMVALKGKVYVGLGGSAIGNLNDWWEYDIATDTWTEKAGFPGVNRHHPYQFTDGEYAYVGFGHGAGIFNDLYRYDTDTDEWTRMEDLPGEGRVAGTQFSYEGFGYVLSGDGSDHSSMETGEFWQYDPLVNDWLQLDPHPGASRWAPASFIIDGEVYIMNGTSAGQGFIEECYKYDLKQLGQPQLKLAVPTTIEVNSDSSDEYCGGAETYEIKVITPAPFGFNFPSYEIQIDPLSTAIRGIDYVFDDVSEILGMEDLERSFEFTVISNAMIEEEKTIIFNLSSSTADVTRPQAIVTIKNGNKLFNTGAGDGGGGAFGDGEEQFTKIFAAYYENTTTQLLYNSDLLENIGAKAGPIEKLTFDVDVINSNGVYRDFRLSIGHSTRQSLNGLDANAGLVEVYRGDLTIEEGQVTITFDQPFEYDGEQSIMIQTCFDNTGFTLDDIVASTDVGYTAWATAFEDGQNGCIFTGNLGNGSNLPNVIIGTEQPAKLFDNTDYLFESRVDGGESAFFSKNDSILLVVTYPPDSTANCVSVALQTASTDMSEVSDKIWMERVVYIDIEGDDEGVDLTLLAPIVDGLDYSTSNMRIFYSDGEYQIGDTPDWTIVPVGNIINNGEYAFVFGDYVGNGSYAIGNLLNTSADDLEIEKVYNGYVIYDILGKRISTDKNLKNTNVLPTGIYVETYLFDGQIIDTKKVYVNRL